jgi:hypothetical protein
VCRAGIQERGGTMQTSEGVDFIGQNLIAIGIIGLLMFIYIVLLIRKRWKKGFLHDSDKIKKD